jgi:hypothetical protein
MKSRHPLSLIFFLDQLLPSTTRRTAECAQYGYLGTSPVIWVPVQSIGKNDNGTGGKKGSKPVEGEIKGLVAWGP